MKDSSYAAALADPEWDTPANLRLRPDADRIRCQKVLSGRWAPLSSRYWDSCVIKVRFEVVGRTTDHHKGA